MFTRFDLKRTSNASAVRDRPPWNKAAFCLRLKLSAAARPSIRVEWRVIPSYDGDFCLAGWNIRDSFVGRGARRCGLWRGSLAKGAVWQTDPPLASGFPSLVAWIASTTLPTNMLRIDVPGSHIPTSGMGNDYPWNPMAWVIPILFSSCSFSLPSIFSCVLGFLCSSHTHFCYNNLR